MPLFAAQKGFVDRLLGNVNELLLLLGSLNTGYQTPPPSLPVREFRAAWVATVDNIDWPSRRDLSSEKQREEMIHLLDVAKDMHLNAIVLQVRPSADALYASRYEPWSEYLTNRQGKAPDPYYDPLAFTVNEAHARGIEVHCWFNPYRANHPAQKGPLAPNHIAKTQPGIVRKYGPYLWMDPGEPEVVRHTLKVILDVVHRYDIDGVHIDDYFYPYKEKGPDGKPQDFPDGASYRHYTAKGGRLDRDNWRRKNVDDFIEQLYQKIKREKRWVKFGISPFGIWRPGYPVGIRAGVDQYAELYADARKWLQLGWCDYMTPQLYWPIRQKAQSYPALLDWWLQQNESGRHLWPGNYTSRTDPSDGSWEATEVLDQIQLTRESRAGGNVHFSMVAFLKNWHQVRDRVKAGPYADEALVPETPWLSDRQPKSPNIRPADSSGRSFHWSGERDVNLYVVSAFVNNRWQIVKVGDNTSVELTGDFALASQISVWAVNRAGIASLPTVLKIE